MPYMTPMATGIHWRTQWLAPYAYRLSELDAALTRDDGRTSQSQYEGCAKGDDREKLRILTHLALACCPASIGVTP